MWVPPGMMQNNRFMKVIGVTGGVGAGKSLILNFIKENYNSEIILADEPTGALNSKTSLEVLDASRKFNTSMAKIIGRLGHSALRRRFQPESFPPMQHTHPHSGGTRPRVHGTGLLSSDRELLQALCRDCAQCVRGYLP